MKIKFKKTNELANNPIKAHDNDAGYDLTATWIKRAKKYIEYGTNIHFEIPDGYVGLLFSRSSITNGNFILKNSVGVIDASYVGEIKFRFYNLSFINRLFKFKSKHNYNIGDKIGQIIFIKLPIIELIETNEMKKTKRGEKAYGSSGK